MTDPDPDPEERRLEAAMRIDRFAEGEALGDPEPDPRDDPAWWPTGEAACARWMAMPVPGGW